MASKTSLEKMYKSVDLESNRLYTSYFSGLSKLDLNNFIVVPICRFISPQLLESIKQKAPYFVECKYLAPDENLLSAYKSNSIDEEDYKTNYSKTLVKFHAKSLLTDIYNFAAGGKIDPMLGGWMDGCEPDPDSEAYKKDIVFVCYEKPGDFCHRHLLAEWLTFNGFYCTEIEIRDTSENV